MPSWLLTHQIIHQNATKSGYSHCAEQDTQKSWIITKSLSHIQSRTWSRRPSLMSNINNRRGRLTMVGLPLLMSCPTSWKMLLQLMLLSTVPLFTMTATASRICSRTYFWRLERKRVGNHRREYKTNPPQRTSPKRRGYQQGGEEQQCRNVVCSQLQLIVFGLFRMETMTSWLRLIKPKQTGTLLACLFSSVTTAPQKLGQHLQL